MSPKCYVMIKQLSKLLRPSILYMFALNRSRSIASSTSLHVSSFFTQLLLVHGCMDQPKFIDIGCLRKASQDIYSEQVFHKCLFSISVEQKPHQHHLVSYPSSPNCFWYTFAWININSSTISALERHPNIFCQSVLRLHCNKCENIISHKYEFRCRIILDKITL